MGDDGMPSIMAYHAQIRVVVDGRVLIIHVDRPDWESDLEILRDFANSMGAETVGEVARGVGGMEGVSVEDVCSYSDYLAVGGEGILRGDERLV